MGQRDQGGDEFATRLWAEIASAHQRLGIYANVQRALAVLGPDAASQIADYHVLRARAEGAIR